MLGVLDADKSSPGHAEDLPASGDADRLGGPAGGGQAAADVRPLLVGSRDASKMCGVSRSHWMSLHSSGLVPMPVNLGRRVMWNVRELQSWIDSRCPSREDWQERKRMAR